MRFGSLFSGVGGMDIGLERAGLTCAWQVEIDARCRSVLARHWPGVPRYEDVRDVGSDTLAPVELVCGGFPCTDLSVAGRRAGLDGARSGLWYEFHRIIGELLPRWVLVENVSGLRSSQSGRDLAIIISGLAQLGYVGAGRSLDARHFGVGQRRERIFLLACRDTGAGCPAEILAIPEGLSGHPAPGREAGEGVTPILEVGARTASGGLGRNGAGLGEPGDPMFTLQAGKQHAVAHSVVAHAVTAHQAKGGDPTTDNYVAHTLRAEGFDASEDGTGRGTPPIVIQQNGSDVQVNDEPGALTGGIARQTSGPIVAFHHKASASQSMNPSPHAPALNTGRGAPAIVHVLTPLHYTHDYNQDRIYDATGIAPAHTANDSNRSRNVYGADVAIPRRLTPRECERLMGWPDDWTRYAADGTEIADGPRYRMCGNGVVASVAEWLGRRLMSVRTAWEEAT